MEENRRNIIVDFDDFCDDNNRLDLLFQLKGLIPNFKVNLFTIMGKSSESFLNAIKEISWIDMIPHGWTHNTPRECENWKYDAICIPYLENIERYGLTRGFKAPGWIIPDDMYQALLEHGYWIADQEYNNDRRPSELKAYLLNKPGRIHGHIQNVCDNGLEERFDYYASLRGNFKFIKEIMKNETNLI